MNFEIKNIYFYNDTHNGDLVATKGFVANFIKQYPQFNYYYSHVNNKKVLLDLPCEYIKIPPMTRGQKFSYDDKNLSFYINTWVGCYLDWMCLAEEKPFGEEFPRIVGINWKNYHVCWQYIHKMFSRITEDEYKLDQDPKKYIHNIDYSKYNCLSAYKFLENYKHKKIVLVSNGLVHSGQSTINTDMVKVINYISSLFPNFLFICTRRINTKNKNVVFTDDIIQDKSGCDLNEIAYISTFADLIIGKNSGPFLFANTYDNIMNPNKKFLSIGNYYEDCFAFGLELPCSFKFVNDKNEQDVIDSILTELKSIL